MSDEVHDAFQVVSEWCEQYLRTTRDQDEGVAFGGLIQAYGSIAGLGQDRSTLRPSTNVCDDEAQCGLIDLDAEAENWLGEYVSLFLKRQECVVLAPAEFMEEN